MLYVSSEENSSRNHGDYMKLLAWISLLLLVQVSYAQSSPPLILGDDANNIATTIQVHQEGTASVFQLGSKIPVLTAILQGLVFGEHIPYPISSYTFVIPEEKCSDWLHCDSSGLIPMLETHITGQEVNRMAAILFSISENGKDRQVKIIIENENGERGEFNGNFSLGK